ncbi:putative 6-phospho-beta-glucosidase [Collinsella aerofaciens]|uniref:Putative 6-phospho-beta-glucosidase n=1 Tax=Collinsella aerofaciens TaxID=74426 RepID=A0A6N2ZRA2_9ACTN
MTNRPDHFVTSRLALSPPAIEANCVITKQGPIPTTTGHLPEAINSVIQQFKSFERTASRAAVTGDYDTALLAMTINPLVPSDTDAKAMLDELLEVNKEYLPQFFDREQA